MKLSAPKKVTWLIALIIGLLAIFSLFVPVPFLYDNKFWVMGIAWVLMMLATLLKGL